MTKKNSTAPEELTDADLEQVEGGLTMGQTYGHLNTWAESVYFGDDDQPIRKTLFAEASGGGNVTGNGGAPAPSEYTFGEDIGADIIPVTYKLGN